MPTIAGEERSRKISPVSWNVHSKGGEAGCGWGSREQGEINKSYINTVARWEMLKVVKTVKQGDVTGRSILDCVGIEGLGQRLI